MAFGDSLSPSQGLDPKFLEPLAHHFLIGSRPKNGGDPKNHISLTSVVANRRGC
jgi:hypothetical protein